MTPSQSAIFGARVEHVRELKAAIAALKADCASLRERCALLESHFALALAAALDMRSVKGRFIVLDGWNLILGSQRVAAGRDELFVQAQGYLSLHAEDFIWIVLDGADGKSSREGALRISYTGGEGTQRADRLILDFVRCAAYCGEASRIHVGTFDRKLASEARRLGAVAGDQTVRSVVSAGSAAPIASHSAPTPKISVS